MSLRNIPSAIINRPQLRLTAVVLACALSLLAGNAVLAQPAATPADPPKNVAEPLPEQAPAWPDGYQVRYTLRIAGARPAESTSKSVVARLPTGGWLKPDGSDVVVLAADGTSLPVTILSHGPFVDTLIQFPRHGLDLWYWVHAVNPNAPAPAVVEPILEGIVLEGRDWKGTDISSWTAVRDGFTNSDPLLMNSFVMDMVQTTNPVRPTDPRQYAVSYRGYLNLKAEGIYRFLVNSEDASFLFIDGFKVCDRPGANNRYTGSLPTQSIGAEVELKAGPHLVEVFHVLTEHPNTYGGCSLLWVPPEAKTFTYVPREMFATPEFGHIAALDVAGPNTGASFGYGIDDSLVTTGEATLYLVRFEAQGDLPADANQLVWDFGDGTQGTGRSVRHVYYTPGDYTVTLAGGGTLPAFQRRVHVWAAPGVLSPLSIKHVIRVISAGDMQQIPPARQDQIVNFLLSTEAPERWPLLEQLSRQRLAMDGLDPQYRAELYKSLIAAVGYAGNRGEVERLRKQAVEEFRELPSLAVGVQLTAAEVTHRQLKDSEAAAEQYDALLAEHRRLEHPDMRRVAIQRGDMLAEDGQLKLAGEMYRLAATLGGEEFLATAQAEAITRGALLRVAEQKLRTGDLRETRMLLDKIELNYPDQKLEGLYRFLRAEADRVAGKYDAALRNYEVLLQLRQWSGYRDKTLHGMAECLARLGQLPEALERMTQIEKAFPKYFEKEKLAERKQQFTDRLARATPATEPNGKPQLPRFETFATSFEPEEPQWFGKSTFKIARGLGFSGQHVGSLESYPIYLGYMTHERPLPNLTVSGHYWAECWYREDMFALFPGFNPHFYLYMYGQGEDNIPDKGRGTYFLERTYGVWRKVGFLLDAPPKALDGRIYFGSLLIADIEIDGLEVHAVTDEELHWLSNFVEQSSPGEQP